MPVARTHAIALVGVEGHPVQVEADIQNGLPGLLLVGLPDTALREARDRIRAAIVNSHEQWPQRRITVGLSPASLPKRGSGFDLGIAIAILGAAAAIPVAALDGIAFLGELGLDGQLRPVRGVLPAMAAAAASGFRRVAVPRANAAEAALVPGLRVFSAQTLAGLLGWLRGEPPVEEMDSVEVTEGGAEPPTSPASTDRPGGRSLDLADVLGQPTARRAAEISAAGGHHLCLLGPPGAGKTMLAERIPTVLPRLDKAAALEVTSIHSVAGVLPDRKPAADASLRFVPRTTPLPRQRSSAVAAARSTPEQPPWRTRAVCSSTRRRNLAATCSTHFASHSSRARLWWPGCGLTARFPARFTLVLAANPCPCGKGPGRQNSLRMLSGGPAQVYGPAVWTVARPGGSKGRVLAGRPR